MKTILITCKNDDCSHTFRIPEYVYGKNIKTSTKQECKICKNKKILEQSMFNRKSQVEKTKPSTGKYTIKQKGTKKRLKTTKKKNINKALDTAWSKLVKLQWDNKCAVCGNRKSLNSHHVYSRAKHSVRWDTINGICLCVKHHIGTEFSAHKTPVDFTLWLMEKKGKAWLMKLKIKSNSIAKFHEFEKEIILNELLKEIKSYE